MLPDYRVRQRDYLLDILRAITSRLDITEVMKLVTQAAVDVMSGSAGLITLIEADGELRLRDAVGLPKAMLDTLTTGLARLRSEIAGGTADEPAGTALVRGHAADRATEALEAVLSRLVAQFGVGQYEWIALPLEIGEEVLGKLYVLRRRSGEFSTNDRQVLQSFADQAAVAVNNARLYEQLNAQKQRLDAILESTADGVVIMDSTHRIALWNKAMSNLTGISAATSLGHAFEDIVHFADKRAGTTLVEAEANGWPLVGSSHPLFVEGDIARADGRPVSVEITFAPIFERDGRLVNIVANVRDITRFRESDRMKSTFVSVVTHELKTPVALIKGYASTLQRTDAHWDAATVSESLKVIEDESDRLAELIDNLLDASRAQAGSFKLVRVELDIDQLVRDVVERIRPQATRHTLVAAVPADLPMVYADHARITQVLTNLLSNAVKYSPEGGEIRVSSRVAPAEVIISVSDHGPGIPADEQPQLFSRFHRLDNALTRRTPGTGLGLFLSKSIVDAHGGRIWVESDGRHGSTFSFSLPRA